MHLDVRVERVNYHGIPQKTSHPLEEYSRNIVKQLTVQSNAIVILVSGEESKGINFFLFVMDEGPSEIQFGL